MLRITTEELSAQPQSTVQRILSFIGATPDCSDLLDKGELPLTNPARSKGRRDVACPSLSDDLKQQTMISFAPTANAS